MKRIPLWKRAGILLLALLMGVMFLFTGCEAEDVDLALDIADAVLEESQTSEQPQQEETVPESSQAPPAENETVSETPATEETPAESKETQQEQSAEEISLEKGGRYTAPEDVALYIHLYGELPSNYITKTEAKKLGWESNKGNLWDVTDQMSMGGDRFGNYEGALPDAEGRTWKECDVNYEGGYRGSERLLYSNDGLIFYTKDHYETFTQLY